MHRERNGQHSLCQKEPHQRLSASSPTFLLPPLLTRGSLCPKLDAAGHRAPTSESTELALQGQRGQRLRSSDSLCLQNPGSQLSPGVRSIMPQRHPFRRALSRRVKRPPPPVGAGSPSRPYVI